MIFYVYFDPQIIRSAYEAGGLQTLIGVLRNLSKNCFLADFDNYYVRNEIGDLLRDLLGDYEITVLKKILTHFSKQNLFIECLKYNYSEGIPESKMAQHQCEDALLDLLLLDDNTDVNQTISVEVATLKNYQLTDFEPVRNNLATEGITLNASSLTEEEFLEKHFKKAFKYAQNIEILDYLCGQKYGRNYEYTIKQFLNWLEKINKDDLAITFHCGFPDARPSSICTDEDLTAFPDEIEEIKQNKLSEAINSHYSKSTIKVICYDSRFSHDRFVITDQIAFSIGAGMDFLDARGKIREISINFKDPSSVKSKLLSENS